MRAIDLGEGGELVTGFDCFRRILRNLLDSAMTRCNYSRTPVRRREYIDSQGTVTGYTRRCAIVAAARPPIHAIRKLTESK
jgi:hypothetical protein